MVNQSVIDSSVDLEQLKDIEDLIPDMDKAISEKVETFLDKSGDQPYAHMNEGAPVCQSFGNENFYYCSCMMNCIFDCE